MLNNIDYADDTIPPVIGDGAKEVFELRQMIYFDGLLTIKWKPIPMSSDC